MRYAITDNQTGRRFELDWSGAAAPTEAELDQIIGQARAGPAASLELGRGLPPSFTPPLSLEGSAAREPYRLWQDWGQDLQQAVYPGGVESNPLTRWVGGQFAPLVLGNLGAAFELGTMLSLPWRARGQISPVGRWFADQAAGWRQDYAPPRSLAGQVEQGLGAGATSLGMMLGGVAALGAGPATLAVPALYAAPTYLEAKRRAELAGLTPRDQELYALSQGVPEYALEFGSEALQLALLGLGGPVARAAVPLLERSVLGTAVRGLGRAGAAVAEIPGLGRLARGVTVGALEAGEEYGTELPQYYGDVLAGLPTEPLGARLAEMTIPNLVAAGLFGGVGAITAPGPDTTPRGWATPLGGLEEALGRQALGLPTAGPAAPSLDEVLASAYEAGSQQRQAALGADPLAATEELRRRVGPLGAEVFAPQAPATGLGSQAEPLTGPYPMARPPVTPPPAAGELVASIGNATERAWAEQYNAHLASNLEAPPPARRPPGMSLSRYLKLRGQFDELYRAIPGHAFYRGNSTGSAPGQQPPVSAQTLPTEINGIRVGDRVWSKLTNRANAKRYPGRVRGFDIANGQIVGVQVDLDPNSSAGWPKGRLLEARPQWVELPKSTVATRARSRALGELSADERRQVRADARAFDDLIRSEPLFFNPEQAARRAASGNEKDEKIQLQKELARARERVAKMLGAEYPQDANAEDRGQIVRAELLPLLRNYLASPLRGEIRLANEFAGDTPATQDLPQHYQSRQEWRASRRAALPQLSAQQHLVLDLWDEARARAWGAMYGLEPGTYYSRRKAGAQQVQLDAQGQPVVEGVPFQSASQGAAPQRPGTRWRAQVDWDEWGRTSYIFTQYADFSTYLHEEFHDLLERLLPQDVALVERYLGPRAGGNWNLEQHERWAQMGEQWLATGEAPSYGLRRLFAKIGQYFQRLWQELKGTEAEAAMPAELRQMLAVYFDADQAAARRQSMIRRTGGTTSGTGAPAPAQNAAASAGVTASDQVAPPSVEPTSTLEPSGSTTSATSAPAAATGPTSSLPGGAAIDPSIAAAAQLSKAEYLAGPGAGLPPWRATAVHLQAIVAAAQAGAPINPNALADYPQLAQIVQGAVANETQVAATDLAGAAQAAAEADRDRRLYQSAASVPVGEGPGRYPGVVLARAEHSRRPQTDRLPGRFGQLLKPHQRDQLNLTLEALEQDPRAFLNASGTGAGKTIYELATAATVAEQDGRPALIVTESDTIIDNAFRKDARLLGLNFQRAQRGQPLAPGVNLATYHDLTHGKLAHLDPAGLSVLVFDESHNLKNWTKSSKAKRGLKLADKVAKVVFASATPIDAPEQLWYLRRLGLFHTRQQYLDLLGELGVELVEREKQGRTQRYFKRQFGVSPEDVAQRMEQLFDRVTGQGLMHKVEVSLEGMEIGFATVPLDQETLQTLTKIHDFYAARAAGSAQSALIIAQGLMAQRRYQEPAKLGAVLAKVNDELAAGRQVIVFATRIHYSEVVEKIRVYGPGGELVDEIRNVIAASEGTIKSLRAALTQVYGAEAWVEVTGDQAADRSANLAAFQDGRAPILLATPQSGGTGLNLDDIVGNAPRSMIIVTPPFSAMDVVQMLGRINRLTTKSDRRVFFILTNTAIDGWNRVIIARKLAALRGSVLGGVQEMDLDRVKYWGELSGGKLAQIAEELIKKAGGIQTLPTQRRPPLHQGEAPPSRRQRRQFAADAQAARGLAAALDQLELSGVVSDRETGQPGQVSAEPRAATWRERRAARQAGRAVPDQAGAGAQLALAEMSPELAARPALAEVVQKARRLAPRLPADNSPWAAQLRKMLARYYGNLATDRSFVASVLAQRRRAYQEDLEVIAESFAALQQELATDAEADAADFARWERRLTPGSIEAQIGPERVWHNLMGRDYTIGWYADRLRQAVDAAGITADPETLQYPRVRPYWYARQRAGEASLGRLDADATARGPLYQGEAEPREPYRRVVDFPSRAEAEAWIESNRYKDNYRGLVPTVEQQAPDRFDVVLLPPEAVEQRRRRDQIRRQLGKWEAIERTYEEAWAAEQALPGVPLADIQVISVRRGPPGPPSAQEEIYREYVRRADQPRRFRELGEQYRGSGITMYVTPSVTPYRPGKGEPQYGTWRAERAKGRRLQYDPAASVRPATARQRALIDEGLGGFALVSELDPTAAKLQESKERQAVEESRRQADERQGRLFQAGAEPLPNDWTHPEQTPGSSRILDRPVAAAMADALTVTGGIPLPQATPLSQDQYLAQIAATSWRARRALRAAQAGQASPAQVAELDVAQQANVVRRSEIMRELSRRLDVPIRTGRFRQRAWGIYKRLAQVIRLKFANDLPVVSHEIGHHFENLLFGVGPRTTHQVTKGIYWPWRDELELLGRPTSRPSYSLAQVLSEGVAEFVSFYALDPSTAQAAAPRFFQEFEQRLARDSEVRDAILYLRERARAWNEQPALAKIMSQIAPPSSGLRPSSLEQLAHQLYTDVVDQMHGLAEAVAELGRPRRVSDNPFALATLAPSESYQMLENFIKRGTYRYPANPDLPFQRLGPGMEEILQPVASRLAEFQAYEVALRMREKIAQGKQVGQTREVVEEAIAQVEARPYAADFAAAHQAMKAWRNQLYDFLADAYQLDPASRAAVHKLNREYVPFYRVFEGQEGRGRGAGRGYVNLFNPIRRFKGSARDIVNPLESDLRNALVFINLAYRNAVGQAMVQLAEQTEGGGKWAERVPLDLRATSFELREIAGKLRQAGVNIPYESGLLPYGDREPVEIDLDLLVTLFRPLARAVPRENIVTVWRGGRQEMYQLDPAVYQGLRGLDPEPMSWALKIAGYVTRAKRAGIVLAPEFAPRNITRDWFTGFVFSGHGLNFARGLFHVLGRTDLYQEWKLHGGPHAAATSLDPQELQRQLVDSHQRRLVENLVEHPLRLLEILGELSEATTRVGEYARTAGPRRQGAVSVEAGRRAALGSKEVTVNFGRHGARTRAVRTTVAFWNPAMQSLDRFFKGQLGYDPYGEGWRGAGPRSAAFTLRAIAAITVPSILLYLANRDDEEYWQIPQWQRDLFWLVRVDHANLPDWLVSDSASGRGGQWFKPFIRRGDHTWFRIPKPFELGLLYGTTAERVMQWLDKRDPAAFDELVSSLGRGALPSLPVPGLDLALPVVENWANRSWFLDRPIVPEDLLGLSPEEQAQPYTSQAARWAGRRTGASPARLEHFVRGYGGGLGLLGLEAADQIGRAAGAWGPAEPPAGLADVPGLRGFVVRWPSTSAEPIGHFYDLAQQIEQTGTTFQGLHNQGRHQEARDFKARHPQEIRDWYRWGRDVSQTRELLSRYRQDLERAYRKGDRESVDRITRRMIDTAARALQRYKQPAVAAVAP